MTALERTPRRTLLALIGIGVLSACNGPTQEPTGPLSGKITVDGSATVLPLTKIMSEGFRQSDPAVEFAIDFSGTGGGFKKFCAGQTDIQNASRPINAAESAECKANHIDFIEVPVAFDSLSVVVNPKNTFVDCLTVAELKAIWESAAEGKIREWNQVRPQFPAQALTLYGPGTASGTFDYFSLAILGTEGHSRSDYAKSEDDTVIEHGVAADPNALGYFGYAYYQANKDELKAVGVDSGHGCVMPSAETVAAGTYQPLSRPLFIYLTVAAARRPEVRAFTHFYLSPDSVKYVKKVGYVPLPVTSLVTQRSRFDAGTTGSAMGGHGSVTGVGLNAFDQEEKQRDRIRDQLVQ